MLAFILYGERTRDDAVLMDDALQNFLSHMCLLFYIHSSSFSSISSFWHLSLLCSLGLSTQLLVEEESVPKICGTDFRKTEVTQINVAWPSFSWSLRGHSVNICCMHEWMNTWASVLERQRKSWGFIFLWWECDLRKLSCIYCSPINHLLSIFNSFFNWPHTPIPNLPGKIC